MLLSSGELLGDSAEWERRGLGEGGFWWLRQIPRCPWVVSLRQVIYAYWAAVVCSGIWDVSLRAERDLGDNLMCDSLKQMMPVHFGGENPINENSAIRGKSGHIILDFTVPFTQRTHSQATHRRSLPFSSLCGPQDSLWLAPLHCGVHY